MAALQLNEPPSVNVSLLVRKPPSEVFEALVNPDITTGFWYTKSSGRMVEGAELVWEWEMYGASAKVSVKEVVQGERLRFQWYQYGPGGTTVTFYFIPYKENTTYLRVTETGFEGDGDAQVKTALASTAGFTFVMSALKATLEQGSPSKLVHDVHRSDVQLPPSLVM